jgi:hypothetical protein
MNKNNVDVARHDSSRTSSKNGDEGRGIFAQ